MKKNLNFPRKERNIGGILWNEKNWKFSTPCFEEKKLFYFCTLDSAIKITLNFYLCFQPHRISVRSVTLNRRTSRDAACTMVIGKDIPLGPTCVRASHLTSTSAVISWLPSNSNHQHTVCVNSVEVRTVKPGVYRHTITGLLNSLYKLFKILSHGLSYYLVKCQRMPLDKVSRTETFIMEWTFSENLFQKPGISSPTAARPFCLQSLRKF